MLPFRLLKEDPDIDFLAFSLADAISMTLSGLDSVVVRSSLTASGGRDRPLDPKTLAGEAGVDAVLTGSLLRSGEQLRVNTQLIAAPEGTILWSHSSQALMSDVFQLQDDVCRRILESLAVPLSARDHGLLKQDAPSSPKAYELYLRANHHAYDAQNWPLARDLYEACLGQDPQYAPAWARLGRCYRLMAKFSASTSEDQQDWLRRADDAFQRALAISPQLPVAHNLYTTLECDLGRATAAVGRLLSLARQRTADAEVFAGLVHACRYAGLLDASIAAHHRARQLDPRVPTSVAHTYWMKGDYERAAEDPFGTLGYIRGLALVSGGRELDARDFLRDREDRVSDPRARDFLFALRAYLEGDRGGSLAALDRVTLNPDPEALFYVARGFARHGEVERAIAELERVTRAFFCYPIFVSDAWLDPLRGDARFIRMLRAVEVEHRRAMAAFMDHEGERVLGYHVS